MIYSDPEVQEINRVEEEKIVALLTGLLESYGDELATTDFGAAARVIHRAAEEVIHATKIFGADIEEERMLGELSDMIYRYLFCKG